jgi:DNA polymerase I-like protein with 3'-5' exonuclease and polymerase domains
MIPNSLTTEINGVTLSVWNGVCDSKLHLINEEAEWEAVWPLMQHQKLMAFDTETTGFQWYKNDRICGFSFGWKDMHFYVPIRHKDSVLGKEQPKQLNLEYLRPYLNEMFAREDLTLIFWNRKFDHHMMWADGFSITCKKHDGRVLWHLFDENAPGRLKTIASGWKDELRRQHTGLVDPQANAKEHLIDLWRDKESKARKQIYRNAIMREADRLESSIEHQDKTRHVLKKWIAEQPGFVDHIYRNTSKEDIDYSYIPVSMMVEYAALDTFITYKVYAYCVQNLNWTTNMSALFKNETMLTDVLFDAETTGVKIDRKKMIETGEKFAKEIAELQIRIAEKLGDINLASTQELAGVLLEQGVELTEQTEKSTEDNVKWKLDKKILKKLENDHEAIADILRLRELSKLKGTYIDGILPKLTDDDILHCNFNQNVKTGRMSSSDPNLQNIPGKNPVIRDLFIPLSDEYDYILIDYSQIELRLTAHYSQDPILMDAYFKGQDIHTRTFCEMFGFDLERAKTILADEDHAEYLSVYGLRSAAKIINFGIIYSVSAQGLSEQIKRPQQYYHLSPEEWVAQCEEFINQYLQVYKGVRRFMSQASAMVAKQGFIETYFGRIRHLPTAHATKITGDRKLFWMEKKAQRQGVNCAVQGTAADLFKIAMNRIYKILGGTKSKLVSAVHDEVHIYLHKSERHLLPKIKYAMENFNFSVPIVVDVSIASPTWGKKRKLDVKAEA